MMLIIEIGLGILLGAILVENRRTILRWAGGFTAFLAIVAVILAIAGAVIYLGTSTFDAVDHYGDADIVGRKILFGVGFVIYVALIIGAITGVGLLVYTLIPQSARVYLIKGKYQRSAFAAFFTAICGIFFIGAAIPLPSAITSYQKYWHTWGWAHGMGNDGGGAFDLLLWQIVWIANIVFLKVYKLLGWASPISDLTARVSDVAAADSRAL